MKLLYVPHGNIPSRWAHSFQAMKMAEALAGEVEALTLITRGSLLPSPISRVDLAAWYGLHRPLHVVRLPLHLWVRAAAFTDVGRRRFDAAALAYARATRPDLVYSRSLRAGRWCIRAGLRTLIETHGSPSGSDFDRHNLLRLRDVAHRPSFAGLVTVTAYLRDRYVELGLPALRIGVWPDAVDLAAAAAAESREVARARFELPAAAPLVVYAGHLYPEKGAPLLLEAARQAPELSFLLVGGWPEDVARLRRQAPPNLTLAGFVPQVEVRDYLSAADLLVLPNSNRFEHAQATSPLKLFEYMAARRPIVASRIPAFCPILRHDENACLVDPDDPEALAVALRELVGDRRRGRRLAEQAWADVQDRTWERRAREVLAWCAPIGKG